MRLEPEFSNLGCYNDTDNQTFSVREMFTYTKKCLYNYIIEQLKSSNCNLALCVLCMCVCVCVNMKLFSLCSALSMS